MICPGLTFTATGRIEAAVSANPTPAKWKGGIGLDSNNKLVIATGAVNANDKYVNGFRVSPNGAVRGTTTALNNVAQNGYFFTSEGRLYISNGSSNPESYHNGQGFSSTGRLILNY